MKRILLVFCTNIGVSDGFLGVQGPNQVFKETTVGNPLHAKKKTKKKKSTNASGGGFGKVVKVKVEEKEPSKEGKDFSVFPALESQVADTLVPSFPDLIHEVGELPGEIYDRLDQIYGFPRFNYMPSEQSEETELNDVSFTDLLSATPKEESKLSDDDFASLLATATTRESESKLSDDDFASLFATATGESESKLSDDNFASLFATATGASVCTSSVTPAHEDSTADTISKLGPFSKMRVLHIDPLVVAIDDFFTDDECDRYVAMSTAPTNNKNDSPFQTNSMTVGKDALAKSQRTSTTWFHHYKSVPELMAKASRLLGLEGIDQWEEPQTVRYRRQEKFTWHLDALSPAESADNVAGQRTATLLVYLTELSKEDGGATIFRDLSAEGYMLKVQPKKGSALLFFPSAGGIPNAPFDIRTLHCGEAVTEAATQDKWISQLWLRENQYTPTAPAGNSHADAVPAIHQYWTDMET